MDSTPQTSGASAEPARQPQPTKFYVLGYNPCGVCRGTGKVKTFDGADVIKCSHCAGGYVAGRVPLEEALDALGYGRTREAAHA
jgi:hypothetical protein